MSRQFRSDDTSKWQEGFGNGAAGSATLSGTYGTGTGGYLAPVVSGTSGQYLITASTGWGISYGGWVCLIHQSQGTGAGLWELNKVMTNPGTTLTLKYPLQNNYGTGSQIIIAVPYSNITISGTLTAPAWDGSTGGIIFLLDKGTTTISGTLTAKGGDGVDYPSLHNNVTPATTGGGFRGGRGHDKQDMNDHYAQYGESYAGVSQNSPVIGQRYYSGGGGSTFSNGYISRSGAGGGHAVVGNGGTASEGGLTVGQDDLTIIHIGAGGGGGSRGDACGDGAASGGCGGGIIFLMTRYLNNTGTITAKGGSAGINYNTNGQGSEGGASSGGGGAGGSILIKSQTAVLGTITAAGGTGSGAGYNTGGVLLDGAGGTGRTAIDYVVSKDTGTVSPAFGSARQDLTLRQPISRRMVI